jgi:hypothetical protein
VCRYGITSSSLEGFYARDRLAEEENETLGVNDFKPAPRVTDAGEGEGLHGECAWFGVWEGCGAGDVGCTLPLKIPPLPPPHTHYPCAMCTDVSTMHPAPHALLYLCPRVHGCPPDKLNDHKSLDRALTHRLVLLVKRKGQAGWGFPGAPRADGVKMVDAARAGLRAAVGPSVVEWCVACPGACRSRLPRGLTFAGSPCSATALSARPLPSSTPLHGVFPMCVGGGGGGWGGGQVPWQRAHGLLVAGVR